VRLGETGRVEPALAEVGEQQRECGEMRIAVAALRLAQDDPRAATAALAPVLDGSAPVTNCGWVIQAFLLEAIACEALGDPAEAGRALEHALDLAERDGAVFAFVLNPAPELLKRHAGHGTAHAALISDVLDLLCPGCPPAGAPGGSGGMASPPRRVWRDGSPQGRGGLGGSFPWLVEPLTDSETRVLRYLPTNLSAPEIAGQLSVSVNTVRTHMRHVYEKLGAHRRAGAVERARALGLLAPSSRPA
jgi:LuxR family transcriptional regulator, maltose regulon positive regulatory protein